MMERGGSAVLRPEEKGFEIEMDGRSSLVAISLSLSSVLRRESARSGFLGGESGSRPAIATCKCDSGYVPFTNACQLLSLRRRKFLGLTWFSYCSNHLHPKPRLVKELMAKSRRLVEEEESEKL